MELRDENIQLTSQLGENTLSQSTSVLLQRVHSACQGQIGLDYALSGSLRTGSTGTSAVEVDRLR